MLDEREVPTAIQEIFEKSRGELDRRVGTLEEAVSALLGEGLGEDLRASAERDAHKLAGSLGMFGLPRGSELARSLEQALDQPGGPAPGEAPRLAESVLALRGQLDAQVQRPEPGSEATNPASSSPRAQDGRALLLVSPDPQLSERLSVEALRRNLRPRRAPTCAAARQLAATEAPDAAVLDVSFDDSVNNDEESLELLAELTRLEPPVPVLVLTGSEALVDRVEVARRGGRGFVARTRSADQVIDAVSEQLERSKATQAKVLAVDDDPVASAALAILLGSSGLAVTTLNDPLRFWEVLENQAPDLVVLDLDMPNVDGVDLCRAVRADVRFGQLPVVFLTANTDPDCVTQIFEAGADDYVSKPIVAPELMTRILNRLDRVRLFRDLADKDSLTGVLSRRRSAAAIEDLLAMADRFGQPVSLAQIDLDHFKRMNDELGHATGDDALRRFGELLTETFRGEDVVGRWGGEEFVVASYGMPRDDGVQRVAEMLEKFREVRFTGRDGSGMRLTFSAGVAEYPRDGADLHELYRAADDALYRAKTAGRNRVLPADLEAGAETGGLDVMVVEDDETLAGVLIDSLQTRGYRTHWLDDGQEAVAALSGSNPEFSPSLILLDIDLPSLNGLAVLRRLAADDALDRSRVLMLTARAGEAEVVEALELGAFDHIAKPFSVPVLMHRIRRALKR